MNPPGFKVGDSAFSQTPKKPENTDTVISLICGTEREDNAEIIVDYFVAHPEEARDFFKKVSERPEMKDAASASSIFEILGKILERLSKLEVAPKYVYQNFDSKFTPLILTASSPDTLLPENVSLDPDASMTSVCLDNKDIWKTTGYGSKDLTLSDTDKKPVITSVIISGQSYTFEDIARNRQKFLNDFFISIFGSEEAVEQARAMMPLKEGDMLYRAITGSEFSKLLEDKTKYVLSNDPSANFENQQMFDGSYSQVKEFAQKTGDGYSGFILRWKVQEPLFYRSAGMNPPRIIPLYPHFLPEDLEISKDGVTFQSIKELDITTGI